jgi:AcrR family transcriptional regulator
MESTKERIPQAALKLFARDGYEAASMRTIAEQLGITKGALYKHYESKQAIFDRIVERMKGKDREYAMKFDVPAGSFKEMSEAYRTTAFERIKAFSVAMFRYWTEDEFASNFRKMLTLEQYRNPEMAKLLHQYLTGGVVEYSKDLIREAAEFSGGKGKDPEILALEYFAPIYLMMNSYDGMDDKNKAILMVERHIDYFMESLNRSTK